MRRPKLLVPSVRAVSGPDVPGFLSEGDWLPGKQEQDQKADLRAPTPGCPPYLQGQPQTCLDPTGHALLFI